MTATTAAPPPPGDGEPTAPPREEHRFARSELQRLIDVLREDGFTVVGPTIDQEAIVYGEIRSAESLPRVGPMSSRQGSIASCLAAMTLCSVTWSDPIRGRSTCFPRSARSQRPTAPEPAGRCRPSRKLLPVMPFSACGPVNWRRLPFRIASLSKGPMSIRSIRDVATAPF